MILKFKQFEGRYDQITGIAVDELWKVIKITKIIYDLKDDMAYGDDLTLDEDGFMSKQIEYDFEGPIEFDLILRIKRQTIDFKLGFVIDGGSFAEESRILIELIIDPDREPGCYNTLNSWLQDTVRHEIEHLTHGGINRISDRPDKGKSLETRRKIQKEKDNTSNYQYYLLEDELTPLVQGMYRKAKTDKKPLIIVFNEFLDIMVEEEIIQPDNKQELLEAWVKEAKRLFPHLKY